MNTGFWWGKVGKTPLARPRHEQDDGIKTCL